MITTDGLNPFLTPQDSSKGVRPLLASMAYTLLQSMFASKISHEALIASDICGRNYRHQNLPVGWISPYAGRFVADTILGNVDPLCAIDHVSFGKVPSCWGIPSQGMTVDLTSTIIQNGIPNQGFQVYRDDGLTKADVTTLAGVKFRPHAINAINLLGMAGRYNFNLSQYRADTGRNIEPSWAAVMPQGGTARNMYPGSGVVKTYALPTFDWPTSQIVGYAVMSYVGNNVATTLMPQFWTKRELKYFPPYATRHLPPSPPKTKAEGKEDAEAKGDPAYAWI